MRYLSLHLPFLPTDRIRRHTMVRSSLRHDTPAAEGDEAPCATVAKVASALRLAAVDARALSLGLKPGMALADARAMHPHLDVHEADLAGDAAGRDALVDWCRRFTPLAAPDGDDGAMLDITGAAHLFGGEAALSREIPARLAAQGFTGIVAIAATPAAAWALARFGGGIRIVPENAADEAVARLFAPLPLAALGLGPAAVAALGQAGLRRIGDLLLRPRAPLVARFGRDVHDRLDDVLGRTRRPISPRFEAPPFLAERRFADGIARREDVEATIFALAGDLCGLLARHGEGARRLDVALYRVDGVVKHIEAGTSRPLRDPLAMARLFRERIEAAGEDGLDTGYGFDVVRLAALAAERLDALQPDWAETEAGGADVADLVDRLGARFGPDRVTRLACADSHQPERASGETDAHFPSPASGRRWPSRQRGSDEGGCRLSHVYLPREKSPHPSRLRRDPFSREREKESSSPRSRREASLDRPLRLFDHPEPIEAIAEVPDGPPRQFSWRRVMHHVAAIEGPERIAPDWWRQDTRPAAGATRDYFRAEDTAGRRFWLYREGLYHETPEPRWFVHGLFA